MNRCSLYQTEMALLASARAEKQFPPELQRHLADCARCRDYWTEIEGLCAFCVSGGNDREADLPAGFHERWLHQIREENTHDHASDRGSFTPFQMGPARAAFATLVLSLFIVWIFRPGKPNLPPLPRPQVSRIPDRSPPTLLEYRLAVSSGELDSLLQPEKTEDNSRDRVYTMLTRSETETDF